MLPSAPPSPRGARGSEHVLSPPETAFETAPGSAPEPALRGRLTGLDVARCLALLGMVTTHVVAARTADGDLSLGQWVAGGRASALFALLAGVGLALATGGREPVHGRERAARSAGIAVRALLVAAVGLQLGALDSGLAVILTYYGVLFLLALPFLGLRAGPLLALGAVWVVAAPVVSQVLRAGLAPHGVESPDGEMLLEPGRLVAELLLTGYYPALPWLAYLLVGLGVGRLDLRGRRVPAVLVVVGAALAVATTLVSQALTRRPAVAEALLGDPTTTESTIEALLSRTAGGMYGVTPPGGPWEWLLVVAPHSATPFDLAQTTGSALAVVGLCLLVVSVLPAVAVRAVSIVFGAGAMTLTLYTLHVCLHTEPVWPADGPDGFRAHVLVLLAIGAVLAALGLRGPLEALVRWASRAAAALVRGRAPA